jgi:hypothetical protein
MLRNPIFERTPRRARAPEEVFDFLVDLRNAPQWEPNCPEVEKTSAGPVGKGTTFRAKKGMARLESEIVEFERPAIFATRDKGRGIRRPAILPICYGRSPSASSREFL